jgi:hypothetical protein
MGGVLANWSNFWAEILKNNKTAAKNIIHLFITQDLIFFKIGQNKFIIILIIIKGFSGIDGQVNLKNP